LNEERESPGKRVRVFRIISRVLPSLIAAAFFGPPIQTAAQLLPNLA
jgi:hypothetical protein